MTRKLLINCIALFLCICPSIEFAMDGRAPAIALGALERGIGISGMEAKDVAGILINQLSVNITPEKFDSLINHIKNIREAETLDIQRAHFVEIIHTLKGPNVSMDPEKISSTIIKLIPTPDGDPLDDALKNALRRVLNSGAETKDESSGINDYFAMKQSSSANTQLRRKLKRYKKIFGAVIGAVTAVAAAVTTILPFVMPDKQECNCDGSFG